MARAILRNASLRNARFNTLTSTRSESGFGPGITGLTLVDSNSNLQLKSLVDGDSFAQGAVNILANVRGLITSVVFVLTGTQTYTRTESVAPHALFGDSGGNYNEWFPLIGSYTLTVTPYNGTTAGDPFTINFTVTALGPTPTPTPYPTPTPTLPPIFDSNVYYFNQDFENTSLYGSNTTRRINNWPIIEYNSDIADNFLLWAVNLPYTYIELSDNCDNGRTTLTGYLYGEDPTTTSTDRVQGSLRLKPNAYLPAYHTSHRMFFDPNLANLTQYEPRMRNTGDAWWIIYEIWSQRNPEWDGDPAGSHRISFSIAKEQGVGQPLYFRVNSETMQPASVRFDDIWNAPRHNYAYDVTNIIGKWFTLDVYIERGEGQYGRVRMTVKPDDGAEVVIFDFNDTTHYPGRADLPYYSLQPFKFYMGPDVKRWMNEYYSAPYVCWNDFKWYKHEWPILFEDDFVGDTTTQGDNQIQSWQTPLNAIPQFHSQLIATGTGAPYIVYGVRNVNGRDVLYAENAQIDPNISGTQRFQWGLYLDPTFGRMEIIHTQHKMFLSPDYGYLVNYENTIYWNQINELWHEGYTNAPGEEIGGSARWNMSIEKIGQYGQLHWAWRSEYMQPASLEFDPLNGFPAQRNFTHPVTNYINRWVVVDYYFNRNGHTLIRFDNDIIFNFMGQNQYPGKPELYPAVVRPDLSQYAKHGPFKIYSQPSLINWLYARGKKLWCMWDDFKWYSK